jgi:hypothetical protein
MLYQKAVDELKKKRGFRCMFTGTDYNKVLNLLKEVWVRYTYQPYATLEE